MRCSGSKMRAIGSTVAVVTVHIGRPTVGAPASRDGSASRPSRRTRSRARVRFGLRRRSAGVSATVTRSPSRSIDAARAGVAAAQPSVGRRRRSGARAICSRERRPGRRCTPSTATIRSPGCSVAAGGRAARVDAADARRRRRPPSNARQPEQQQEGDQRGSSPARRRSRRSASRPAGGSRRGRDLRRAAPRRGFIPVIFT